jgi:hypothetical protein
MSARLAGRRALLAGAALAVPATAALPAPKSDDPISDAANALAAAMQVRHGGRWSVTVDHENCFVLMVEKGGAL